MYLSNESSFLCLTDDSTMTVFGEALLMTSPEGVTVTQSDFLTESGSDALVAADGKRNRKPECIDDHESMSPIDLSLTTGVLPSGEDKCIVSFILLNVR